MNARKFASRVVAALLILALQLVYGPVWAAAPLATLSGRVIAADSHRPLVGARVHVGDPKNGSIHSSQPTAADGSFTVSGLPAASYELAIQSGSGMYMVPSAVALASGESRNVHLAVQAQQTAPSPEQAQEKKKKDLGFWNNPLTATLVVLGSAIVVGVIVDEATDDDEASP